MLIQKTPSAATALANRAACSLRERQLLIMCNGKRSSKDIVALMGQESLSILLQLENKGLLTGVSAFVAPPPPNISTQAPAVASEPQAAPAPPRPHRAKNPSLAASKIYILDLLQLQQNDGASQIAQSLRNATAHEEILGLILTALDAIVERSGESYGERAVQRVFEVIPDAHLQAFIHSAMEFKVPLFDKIAQAYLTCIPESIQ